MKYNELRDLAEKTPFIDTHSHLLPLEISGKSDSAVPTLAELLLDLSCRPSFAVAGMDPKLIAKVFEGEVSHDAQKNALCEFLPYVEHTSAVLPTIRGILELYGINERTINYENYDYISQHIKAKNYNNFVLAAGRFNIEKICLNLQAEPGAA